MTTPSSPDDHRDESILSWRWLRRFDPCYVLSDADGQAWATDRHRLHRLPSHVRSVLGHPDGSGDSVELLWPDDSTLAPAIVDGPDWSVQDVMDWLPGSASLRPWSISAHDNCMTLVTGDLQLVHMNIAYGRDALDDGAQMWVGRGPHRPVFGARADYSVVAVIMPVHRDDQDHERYVLPQRGPSA